MAHKDDYQDFKVALNDLKMNSKPLINCLTILAEEKMHIAPQIVRVVEERIFETGGDHVLPTLYVLDSIVKNLRSSIYVQLFEARLPVLFAHAFNKVDEHTRSAMFKLRQTWPPFFTNLSLYNLDTRTHDIDPAWPITARVPDPSPFLQNAHLKPSFLQANATSSKTSTDQPISDEAQQTNIRFQQEDIDPTVFRTRTVHQPPLSVAPPKISELSARSDAYHTIPTERMERIRQETAHVLDVGVDGQLQSKIRKLCGKKKKSNKKRRPSARLRRRAMALAQATVNNDQEMSSEDESDEEANHDDDDADDEPFIIKQSSAIINKPDIQPMNTIVDNKTNSKTYAEPLFGGIDKDYRSADEVKQQAAATYPNNLDADSIFEINSKCLRLAEQKYKSKELSFEEYQATLKLLQNILESEVKRLTIQQTASTILNGSTHSSLAAQTSSPLATMNTTPSHPFQQQLLQFAHQHATHLLTPSQQQHSSLPTFSNPSLPVAGLGNDAYRHVMQILTLVGAPPSYSSHYNTLPFIPPLPPAPPSFTLVQNAFQSQTLPDQQVFAGHQSPPSKRSYDETNNNNNNSNSHLDEENKRVRYDPVTGRAARTRNFDEENVAPVPSLIDANINMLKKKYVGIVQRLYIGKFQCRLCGLRFTAKQKNHYNHHLDWHYLENKQEKDLTTPPSIVALSQRTRHWYSTVQEWTIYEEDIEEQIRIRKQLLSQTRPIKDSNNLIQGEHIQTSSSSIVSCPAIGDGDGEDDRCHVCHDPFENFFDDNREEWHLKDAIRIDGKTYHPICYQDVKDEASDEQMPETDQSSGDTTSLVPKPIVEVDNPFSSNALPADGCNNIDVKNTDPGITVDTSIPSDDSTLPVSSSYKSLVDLVETIYVKKEDLKSVDNIEQQATNTTEESMHMTTVSEDTSPLTGQQEPQSDS